MTITGSTGTFDADVVYIATQRYKPGDQDVTFEMRATTDGQLAMMVYSSLETLVAGAGEEQPWIAVKRDDVERLVADSPADGVLLDTVIPPSKRDHGPGEGVGA